MVRDLTDGTGSPTPKSRAASRVSKTVRGFVGMMPDLWDLHVYGGGLLVAGGFYLAWPPGGLIAAGALLLYLGLAWSPRRPIPKKEKEGE